MSNKSRRKKREIWGRLAWAVTIFLIIFALPIGLVALLRWLAGKEVYYTGFEEI